MRRTFLLLATAVLAFGALSLGAGAASASGPSLYCSITPGSGIFTPNSCGTRIATSSYTLDYLVMGGSGTYTYSWTPPAGTTVIAGCTSTNPDCEVSILSSNMDISAQAIVVITQGSTQTTVSAFARILAVCGNMFC